MIKKNVAGIVVLYNPDEYVIDNIISYIYQIDKLFIIDNSDKSIEFVSVFVKSNPSTKYIFNGNNLGVAAALNTGAKLAIDEGYEFLLTMDQDSFASEGMVEKMIEQTRNEKNVGLIVPRYIDKIECSTSTDLRYLLCEKTSGNILNLESFKQVGLFREDYFIDYVDVEYGYRLNLNKWKLIKVNSAVLYHNEGQIVAKKWFFKFVHPYNYPPLRYYYRTRNLLLLKKEYRRAYPDAISHELKIYLINLIKMILYEPDKIKKIKMIATGIFHYYKKYTGKFIAGNFSK